MGSTCDCTEMYALGKRVDELETFVYSAPSTKTGLASLADTWWIPAIAYFVALFPWAIVYNMDYISEKWRTVRHTRYLGRLHLVFIIIPMPIIIFYAHLQQISGDYKELMTALVAIFLSMFHVFRTGWGLMQLDMFSKWCSVLLRRMPKMDMIKSYDWNDFEDDEVRDWNSLMKNADRILKVNNTVVDNEFSGMDLTVKIGLKGFNWRNPSSMLTIDDKELCLIRWSGSFLSSFGEFWNGKRPYSIDQLLKKCRKSLYWLTWVTFPDNEKKVCFCSMGWKEGGPYNSFLEPFDLFKTPGWLERRRRELENLMGAYPAAGKRRYERHPDVNLVHALMCAQSLNEGIFNSLIDYHSKFDHPFLQNGWALLLWQNEEMPSDLESEIMSRDSVPLFPWRALMVPLWDKNTNWRVLQASVHFDNSEFPKPPIMEESGAPPECWFEYTRNALREERYQERRYVGAVLESVRTFFAVWISCGTPISMNPDWRPELPSEKFEFSINQDVGIEDVTNSNVRARISYFSLSNFWWRWECQTKLQATIADIDMQEANLPSCKELILLFLLGLPCHFYDYSKLPLTGGRDGFEEIVIVTEEGQGVLLDSFQFIPIFSPQNIKVQIQIFELEGKADKRLEIHLMPGPGVTEFHWEDWINSAMGYIQAADDVLSRKEAEDGTKSWRKRTARKVNLSGPLVTVSTPREELPGLPGDIEVWTGWPFFDIKITQFEINGWMRAVGRVNESRELIEPDYENFNFDFWFDLENAEEGLMEINEWTNEKWNEIMAENLAA